MKILQQIKSYFKARRREKDIKLAIAEQWDFFLAHKNWYHWQSLPYQYVNEIKQEAQKRTNDFLRKKNTYDIKNSFILEKIKDLPVVKKY